MKSNKMKNQNFLVRRIQENDNKAIQNIIETVMTEFGAVGQGFSIMDPEVKSMFESYSCNGSAFFIIDIDNKTVGGAGIAQLKEEGDKVCELKKMYVLPEARGRGVGRVLMEECLKAAKDLGYKFCYLETLSNMKSASILYEKYGFEKLSNPMGNTGHFGCNKWYLKQIQ
jgi:putative acetyltransferase